jgi:hypothetical protein
MCGITGWVSFEGDLGEALPTLEAMTLTMALVDRESLRRAVDTTDPRVVPLTRRLFERAVDLSCGSRCIGRSSRRRRARVRDDEAPALGGVRGPVVRGGYARR